MRILKTLIIVTLSVTLWNCTGTNDELWFNADGSGTYQSNSDMSQVLPFLLMAMESEKEGEEDAELEMFKSLFSGEKIDTIFPMKTLLDFAAREEEKSVDELFEELENEMFSTEDVPDSIRSSFANVFDFIRALKLRIQLDKEERVFNIGTIYDFSEFGQMKKLAGDFVRLSRYAGEQEAEKDGVDFSPMQAFDMIQSSVSNMPDYVIDGNYFRYKFKGIDMSSLMEDGPDGIGSMMSQFMGAEDYSLTIHLPGKIKNIKASNDSVEKIDKKTIVIKTPLKELYNADYSFDLEVKFKNKKR
ncbi:MAG: hypothetical protein DWQ02_05385 [Bacteroidetes bacterium]|nr:MAG: hypothetical protein DWQ02_05385 [Bacteroidota bacterium]